MTNRLQQANDGLWAVLSAAFAGASIERNVSGRQKPKARDGAGLMQYLVQTDDMEPEVINAFAGAGGYDVRLEPKLEIAFEGGSKADRLAAAWASVEALKAALAADRTLGGKVEHAQVDTPMEISPPPGSDWMTGGLEVPVSLLFNTPTLAG